MNTYSIRKSVSPGLTAHFPALVKPEAPSHADRLSRCAVGQQGIGMKAGNWRVRPHTAAILPGREDPPIAVAHSGEGLAQNLIVIGLRVEVGSAL